MQPALVNPAKLVSFTHPHYFITYSVSFSDVSVRERGIKAHH